MFIVKGMHTPQAPIGIFDSGVGGLTVWKELVTLMPGEDTVYLADSAHAPYGEKPREAIMARSAACTEQLLDFGAKMVVVACNTATTNAIRMLRERYPIPFIGIEPAIKPAALQSATGIIGVLATRGTLASDLFAKTSRNFASEIRILEREGEDLVQRIEQGGLDSAELRDKLEAMVGPMVADGMDHLVLGCTHYPLLTPILKELLPPHVQLVDCGLPVARQAQSVLEREGLLRPSGHSGQHRFLTNGNPAIMDQMLRRLGQAAQSTSFSF